MSAFPQPQWIAKMFAGTVGRDHLGLGSVSSDQILPMLSPAINVLTDHPRYHSFYVFLLDEFWRRDLPRSHASWVQFFRPREFIFSLGSHMCDRPEHGNMPAAVGSQRTRSLARRQLSEYDTTFNYIKRDLGGYGLYYRSVMAELGLIYPGGRGLPYPVDVPSELGKELAEAYRGEVAATAYYREYFDQDAVSLPLEVIRDYARKACLCQLRRPDVGDHSLVLQLFLESGGDEQAAQRRETFRFLLDLVRQTGGQALDESRFRQLIYFRADDAGAQFSPTDGLEVVARSWRLYQAREYYAFALNALWCHLCDWGIGRGGDVRPIPLSDWSEYLERALDFDSLASELGVREAGLTGRAALDELVRWLEHSVGDPQDFDAETGIGSPLNEHRLHQIIRRERGAPIVIAAAIVLLATVARRFDSEAERFRPEWRISRMGADGRLSVDGFVRVLRRLRASGASIGAVVDWLYADYVILQHELVALAKLPDNTFRFRREGDRLRFTPFANPLEFNNSRFGALTTTLNELGLCTDVREPDHPLTALGLELLDRLDGR